jgi:hypothetical protein
MIQTSVSHNTREERGADLSVFSLMSGLKCRHPYLIVSSTLSPGSLFHSPQSKVKVVNSSKSHRALLLRKFLLRLRYLKQTKTTFPSCEITYSSRSNSTCCPHSHSARSSDEPARSLGTHSADKSKITQWGDVFHLYGPNTEVRNGLFQTRRHHIRMRD